MKTKKIKIKNKKIVTVMTKSRVSQIHAHQPNPPPLLPPFPCRRRCSICSAPREPYLRFGRRNRASCSAALEPQLLQIDAEKHPLARCCTSHIESCHASRGPTREKHR